MNAFSSIIKLRIGKASQRDSRGLRHLFALHEASLGSIPSTTRSLSTARYGAQRIIKNSKTAK